jgi:wyosine [tRNA(Phe)-imidazoG37] synthetase (radical SAM superfamily)
LASLCGVTADFATFSGMGEPTLAANLGEAIKVAREILGLPVAVLTNTSLLIDGAVRRDLSKADVVIAKLDAPNEDIFQLVNRPAEGIAFENIIESIKRFRQEYRGMLALQMMFMELNRQHAKQMAELAASLRPDVVQLNTPLRPCPVAPLPPSDMAAVKAAFGILNTRVTMVYEVPEPRAVEVNKMETAKRRPVRRARDERKHT